MSTNRLAALFADRLAPRFALKIAAPRQCSARQAAFVACPTLFINSANAVQHSWQMSIYRLAYEKAQATVAARHRARTAAYHWN